MSRSSPTTSRCIHLRREDVADNATLFDVGTDEWSDVTMDLRWTAKDVSLASTVLGVTTEHVKVPIGAGLEGGNPTIALGAYCFGNETSKSVTTEADSIAIYRQ